jgi:hypothetical protein
MAILSHFDSVHAKPGGSFLAKNTHGFAGKLHSAIQQNFHGLGTLKDNKTAVEAINTQVLKNQSVIRKGGLSRFQAEKMVAKIHHEMAQKGEHLTTNEKEALNKLTHHLTKRIIQHEPNPNDQVHHGITSLGNIQHTSTVSQIGDKTRLVSGQTPHASGGIANTIKNKGLSINSGPTIPKLNRPSSFKLSI